MKILVLVARGLQTATVGCYGNSWVDTPSLDALAAEGVVFDQHYADAASPAGARRAWRSGHYRFPGAKASEVNSPDLLDTLNQQGIATRLVADDSRPWPEEFATGWQEVHRATPEGDDTPLEATLAAAQEQLEALADEPSWLLWVELANLLPPWETPAEFQDPYFQEHEIEDDDDEEVEEDPAEDQDDEEPLTPLDDPGDGLIDRDDDELYLRIQSTYAAAVSYLDAGIGQLLAVLEELGIADETLVVVLSDCGQALGEHGAVGTVRPWLHEEVVHLPLLMRLPDRAEAGRRVAALTQAVDLAPTLIDAFDLPPPVCHGQSLLGLAQGESDSIRTYVCSGVEVAGGVEWRLQTPEWAFLLPVRSHPEDGERAVQLYVKPDDRWEVNDVRLHHLEWVDRLEQTLRDFVAATGEEALQPPPLPRYEDEQQGTA